LSLVEQTALAILKIDPSDKDGLHCLYVSLIQQNKYAEVIKQYSTTDTKNLFFKAYAHYRLSDDKSCQDCLGQIPVADRSEAVDLLLAQSLYRNGDGKKMSMLMEQFLQDGIGEPHEVKVNLIAAYVAEGEKKKASSVANQNIGSSDYELIFNLACSALDGRNFAKAMSLIDQSIQIHKASLLSEGTEEVEIFTSSAALLVQRAYILQSQGMHEEARLIYESVLQAQPSDEAAIAVASNNIIAMRGSDEKLFDSLKKSHRASSVPTSKLPGF
jgi:signal recognition particle subunit SRP72